MMKHACPVCGEGPVREVTEDRSSFGRVYHNQVHSMCEACGFDGVNGEQMHRNNKQPVTEICGPFKPITIHAIHNANVYFDWGWDQIGFGQLSFSVNKETGEIRCMNECMSRSAVRKLLRAFTDHIADTCILEDDE